MSPLCALLRLTAASEPKLTSSAFSLERDEALEGDAIAAAAPDAAVSHGQAWAFRDVLSAVVTVPYTAGGSRHSPHIAVHGTYRERRVRPLWHYGALVYAAVPTAEHAWQCN